MLKIYAPWMLDDALYAIECSLYGWERCVLKSCEICKGVYPVRGYVEKLLRCLECADLSYRLQSNAGRIPDTGGHFSETLFP